MDLGCTNLSFTLDIAHSGRFLVLQLSYGFHTPASSAPHVHSQKPYILFAANQLGYYQLIYHFDVNMLIHWKLQHPIITVRHISHSVIFFWCACWMITKWNLSPITVGTQAIPEVLLTLQCSWLPVAAALNVWFRAKLGTWTSMISDLMPSLQCQLIWGVFVQQFWNLFSMFSCAAQY